MTEPAYRADRLFQREDPNYDPDIHKLAQKIEWGDKIALDDVAWLGERIDQRHGKDITLLFHALSAGNIAAVDALLAAGADTSIPDKVSGSDRNFVYYLTLSGGDILDQPGINRVIASYLEHGGNPNGTGGLDENGKLLHGLRVVLPEGIALSKNYEGLRMVLAAGADPWLPVVDKSSGEYSGNAVDALARAQAFALLDELIESGYFDNRSQLELEHFLTALGGYAQRRDDASREIKRIAMRVLKRNPHYIETATHDVRTPRIFKDHWSDPEPGEIPWDEIRSDRVK
ncbi:hypothetical protein [Paracoccus saliphilus]|uniref:Ankyrin repeat-containing protein n=1 Tax=Paracoccus saliphilus TaxID=405559 RepID=A0ABY7S6L3_9RHOB|nr:hypothetical protein [Paracoccus saliphilus]WCR02715.1 hypothetical protein JHX88_18025 [Paracoccus saliphilus]